MKKKVRLNDRKEFQEFGFDLLQCRKELEDYHHLLDEAEWLQESRDILPFFHARPQLSAFIGSLNPEAGALNRLAFEYQLFGDFTCDLVIGDSNRHVFTFVEFEGAQPESIFTKKRDKNTPEWSAHFDHGYSQIIDWFWKLDNLRGTPDLEHRFGGSDISYAALLVIGRGKALAERETHRLTWRQRNVVVNNRHVNCYTYDQLYEALAGRMDFFDHSALEKGKR